MGLRPLEIFLLLQRGEVDPRAVRVKALLRLTMETKLFFQFGIIMNVLVGFFCFI